MIHEEFIITHYETKCPEKIQQIAFALVKHFGTPKSKQTTVKDVLEEGQSDSIDDSSSQSSTPSKKKTCRTSRECFMIPKENLELIKELFNFNISDDEFYTCLGWIFSKNSLIKNACKIYKDLVLKNPFEDYENQKESTIKSNTFVLEAQKKLLEELEEVPVQTNFSYM